MQSFYISTFPELMKNPDMKEVKKLIKEKTGIDEENQRYKVTFEYYGDGSHFWDNAKLEIYDSSKYRAKLLRNFYTKDFTFDLNREKNIAEIASQQTTIPENRLEFISQKLNEESGIQEMFRDKISIIRITKELNDTIKLKYPNSEIKEIKTDLYNTGFELLEQIQNNKIEKDSDIKYILVHDNKNLILDDLLIHQGIKEGDLIEINNTGIIHISVKTLTGKTMFFDVPPNLTIRMLKRFIEVKEYIPISEQRIAFEGKQLEDNRTIDEYEIKNESTLHLILRLVGG